MIAARIKTLERPSEHEEDRTRQRTDHNENLKEPSDENDRRVMKVAPNYGWKQKRCITKGE